MSSSSTRRLGFSSLCQAALALFVLLLQVAACSLCGAAAFSIVAALRGAASSSRGAVRRPPAPARFTSRRRALRVDAQLAGSLVDQVDGLVRQEAVGDVALAELGRRLQASSVILTLWCASYRGAAP